MTIEFVFSCAITSIIPWFLYPHGNILLLLNLYLCQHIFPMKLRKKKLMTMRKFYVHVGFENCSTVLANFIFVAHKALFVHYSMCEDSPALQTNYPSTCRLLRSHAEVLLITLLVLQLVSRTFFHKIFFQTKQY